MALTMKRTSGLTSLWSKGQRFYDSCFTAGKHGVRQREGLRVEWDTPGIWVWHIRDESQKATDQGCLFVNKILYSLRISYMLHALWSCPTITLPCGFHILILVEIFQTYRKSKMCTTTTLSFSGMLRIWIHVLMFAQPAPHWLSNLTSHTF